MEFKDVVTNRHSVNHFLEDFVMTKEDINKIIDLTRLAPSCFNLQHTRYEVILNKKRKEEFRETVCPQYKVHMASAVILVVGKIDAYIEAKQGMDPEDYEGLKAFYETPGPNFKRDEAIRNASLNAMMFLMVAKDLGFDTCPMMGFDQKAALKFFNLDETNEPVLLITIGKENPAKAKERDTRKLVSELVKYY